MARVGAPATHDDLAAPEIPERVEALETAARDDDLAHVREIGSRERDALSPGFGGGQPRRGDVATTGGEIRKQAIERSGDEEYPHLVERAPRAAVQVVPELAQHLDLEAERPPVAQEEVRAAVADQDPERPPLADLREVSEERKPGAVEQLVAHLAGLDARRALAGVVDEDLASLRCLRRLVVARAREGETDGEEEHECDVDAHDCLPTVREPRRAGTLY
jgi:hypothetical protein